MTIITDGYENASRTWSGSQIKSLVEELRQMGWTFTYIGADQDVEKVAGGIGVRNCLRFSADEASTLDMFAKERSSRRRYYGAMQAKLLRCESSLSEDTDFFAEEKRMPEVDRQESTKKGSVLAKLLKRK